MTPNAALNVILAGHGATCSSYALTCKRCEREHEATEVLRGLIASATTESAAYARGLADGSERERAAVVKYQRRTCCLAQAAVIEAGKHLAGESE